jgi:Domain of unknown function (DUF4145)
MKCPHCDIGIHRNSQKQQFNIGTVTWTVNFQACPECRKEIIDLEAWPSSNGTVRVPRYTAYPPNRSVRPVPPEVTDPYRQDFIEACAVFPLSTKASAALSRRNLQAILRDKAGTIKKDLFDQIDEVIESGRLPSHIEEGLHAVRNIGNFAAHPMKSTATGAIVDVEEGEAEWNLDVLESLFDFYFVQPALTAKRKAELNKKLKEAGKPELP